MTCSNIVSRFAFAAFFAATAACTVASAAEEPESSSATALASPRRLVPMGARVQGGGSVDLPGVFFDQTLRTPCQLRRVGTDDVRCLPGIRVEFPASGMTGATSDQLGLAEAYCSTSAECDAMAGMGLYIGDVLYVDAACTKVGVVVRDTALVSADDTRFVFIEGMGGGYRKVGARAPGAFKRGANSTCVAFATPLAVFEIGDAVPTTAFAEVRSAFSRR